MNHQIKAIICALLAAALYAISIPVSKILLQYVPATMMAAFLYLGAGIGLLIYAGILHLLHKHLAGRSLNSSDLPYTFGMVLLDIAAPIFLMYGIQQSSSASASLLSNFEMVATSLIAFFIFREKISNKLWISIVLVTAASILLGLDSLDSLHFQTGSLLVLAACTCWGFENNCTRRLSSCNPIHIVIIKGCFSGLGSLITALLIKEAIPAWQWILPVMLLGFVSYGLSISFYIRAQRDLGAAKTSALYAAAPFIGVFFSMILLHEHPGLQFYLALAVMILSTFFLIQDTLHSRS